MVRRLTVSLNLTVSLSLIAPLWHLTESIAISNKQEILHGKCNETPACLNKEIRKVADTQSWLTHSLVDSQSRAVLQTDIPYLKIFSI